MSQTTIQPTLIPYLAVSEGKAAMAWYEKVFGASTIEGEVFEMDDGRLGHASLQIGDAKLYLSDEYPEMNVVGPSGRGGTTVSLIIHVDDADQTYALAVEAGATAERPVENQHGARSGWFCDPWGHRWSPTSAAK